jgi:hypothetical protein
MYILYKELKEKLKMKVIASIGQKRIIIFGADEVHYTKFEKLNKYVLNILINNEIKYFIIDVKDILKTGENRTINTDDFTIFIVDSNIIYELYENIKDEYGYNEYGKIYFQDIYIKDIVSICKKRNISIGVYKYISDNSLERKDLNNLEDQEIYKSSVRFIDIEFDVWAITESQVSQLNSIFERHKCNPNNIEVTQSHIVNLKTMVANVTDLSVSEYLKVKEILRYEFGGDQFFSVFINYDIKDII